MPVILFEVTAKQVERVYGRAMDLQIRHKESRSRLLKQRGLNMAIAKVPAFVRFLDQSTEVMRKLNDEQASRLQQDGRAMENPQFTEFATWREAYLKIDQWAKEQHYQHEIYAWIYAAVGEEVMPPG